MALANYQGYVENVSTGKALPGAVIRVYSFPGNVLQSTFADLSSTPLPSVVSDANGFFEFYIADGAYDLEYVFNGDVLTRLTNVPIYNPANFADGISEADVAAGLALGPSVVKGNSASLFNIQKADGTSVGKVGSLDAYTGTGSATAGAPRLFFGTNTPTNDDSAVCVGRGLVGTSLFSHAFRDESTFTSNLDSAYTAFDARYTINTNSGAKYNHSYGFQWNSTFAATNGVDLFSAVLSAPNVTAGTVDRLHHIFIKNPQVSGTGALGLHAGIWIDPLTNGTGGNFAIYQAGSANINYFAGKFRCDNAFATFSVTAKSTLVEFPEGGGTAMIGIRGASAYGGLQAYSDSFGTVKGLAIQPDGGQTLIKGTVPVTGADLEVQGSISGTNITGSLRTQGQDIVATGTWTAAVTTGVLLAGIRGASSYGAIQAFGGGAVKGLSIQQDGGQTLVGGASPVTGETLEVLGNIGTSGIYRVDGIKVVGNQGAAIADATDAATAISQLNLALAALRTHGLIAT